MSIKRQKKKLNYKSAEVQKILAKKLDKFCRYLNSEYHINAGGCCYVTYVIASLLRKDGFHFKVIIWSTEDDVEENKFYNVCDSHYHYGLLLGGCFINENGCHNDYTLYESIFSKVRVIDILNHYKSNKWNDYYDKNQNSFIYKVIKIFYDNITDSLRERQEYCLCKP